MANNRMYLVHVPSKKAVYLGKRMLDGWYDVPENLAERVQLLFEVGGEFNLARRDDFTLYMEDASMAPNVSCDPDLWDESLLSPDWGLVKR